MNISLLSRLSDNYPLNDEDDFHWAKQSHDVPINELKMLLISRSRLPGIDDIPLVNASVLNYGIDESFSETNEINARRLIMETRLRNVIARFEPRLTQVSLISDINKPDGVRFILQGVYLLTPVELELTWDDCAGRFYFNE